MVIFNSHFKYENILWPFLILILIMKIYYDHIFRNMKKWKWQIYKFPKLKNEKWKLNIPLNRGGVK